MNRLAAFAVVGASALVAAGAASSRAPFITYWDPVWSPNGKSIAFVDRGDTDGDLYLVAPDGSDLRKLTHSIYASGNYGARDPSWSPDGRKVAFGYGYDGISVIAADGSGLQRVTTTGHQPAWSPRGRRIAFGDPDWPTSSIWVMRPDGTGRTLVASPPPEPRTDRTLFSPAWSPDGELLAFCVGTGADSTIKPGYLGIISRYRGHISRVLRNKNPSYVDWGPRGRNLVVAFDPITNDPNGFTNIRVGVFDLRTHRLRQLHFGNHPTWSPNGRRIAFTYKGDIWVMNANGTGAHRITHRPT
jgi:Tol biopolymer transport system component